MKKLTYIILILLTACNDINNLIGKKQDIKLEGKRTYIINSSAKNNLKDHDRTDKNILVSEAFSNAKWLESNYIQTNIPENIKFSNSFQTKHLKFANLSGLESYSVPNIVITEDRIYIRDNSKLTAYSQDNLKKTIWSRDIYATGYKKPLIGGGMVFYDNKIYLTAGHREVIAINALNGKEIWRYSLNNISRSTPIVFEDKVFVMTIDNRLYTLNAADGSTIWRFEGAGEDLGLFASPAVTIANHLVLVPHSSGQLHALNISNGEEIWSVNLSYSKSGLEGFIFNDIDVTPFVKNDIIYIVGNMGLFYAIDLYTGEFIWQQELKGVSSFWVNGEFLYLINEARELISINILDGKFKWATKLIDMSNEKQKNKNFYGPVLANDKLMISTNQGELISVSPYNGEIIEAKKIDNSFISAPRIVGNKIYLFNSNSTLSIIE